MKSNMKLKIQTLLTLLLITIGEISIIKTHACEAEPEAPTITVSGAQAGNTANYYVVEVPESGSAAKTVTLTASGTTPCPTAEEKCTCENQTEDPQTDGSPTYTFTKPSSIGTQAPNGGSTVTISVTSSTASGEYKFKVTKIEQKYKACKQGWTGGVATKSNTEPSEEVTVLVPSVLIEKASIEDEEFKIQINAGSKKGNLSLKLKKGTVESVLFQSDDIGTGVQTISLEEHVASLSSDNGKKFTQVIAEFTVEGVTIESETVDLDHEVEVLASYKVTNYFSPDWNGTWNGVDWNPIGMYAAGQYPTGLSNVTKKVTLLNMMDHATQGLSVVGSGSTISSVIRFQYRAAQEGFQRWNMNNNQGAAYIENPDRHQDTAGCSSVTHLRDSSAAVRTDNPKLSCGDKVYVPDFGIRDIDDHGSLSGSGTLQIDIYRGIGASSLRDQVFSYTKTNRVLLKLIQP